MMKFKNNILSGSLMALFRGFEGFYTCENRELGFTGIIAIHDTTLGPALGGCRRMAYPSRWDAFVDVSRLARGMTSKAAMTDYYNGGLPLGGGKCLLIQKKKAQKLRKLQYQAMGAFVDSLGGNFITAEDVGTSVADIDQMAKETKFVCGKMEGHPFHGNPAPYTAEGVFYGMLGAFKALHGEAASLAGRSVYVEGIGSVGMVLAKLLHEAGATLFVSNRTETEGEREALMRAQDEFGATIVSLTSGGTPTAFPAVEIYAPCALGGIASQERIRAYPETLKLIAGSANNVLLDPYRDGKLLRERGILYAPDYVINNRGLWDVFHQLKYEQHGIPYDPAVVHAGCKENEPLLLEIMQRASKESACPHEIADRMASEVIQKRKSALTCSIKPASF